MDMPSRDDVSMQGRVCLVTGANSGIGQAASLRLAQMGATVVMVARSRERGEAARADVLARSGGSSVDLLLADLSSQAEVRRLASEVQSRYERLHVLINNAAIIPSQRTETVDGVETQLAVNVLAPFLLMNLLGGRLKAGASASYPRHSRIVNVSSMVHWSATLNLDDLQSADSYALWGWSTYGMTKLALLLLTREAARRLQGEGVTANALHPGVYGTHLTRGLPRFVDALARLFLPRPRRGGRALAHLAASPDVEGETAHYYARMRPAPSSPASADMAAAARLWQFCADLTHLSPEESL
jgi:NAD(P)-dependent dehydrogenase (short-subunit alcohol dehydrogenase family)